jgi:putative membrane protein
MRIISAIIILLILILGVTFASLNAEPVVVNYYLGSSKLPLSLLLVLILGCGALLGILVSIPIWARLKKENYTLSHRIKVVEKELANLRISPLNEAH